MNTILMIVFAIGVIACFIVIALESKKPTYRLIAAFVLLYLSFGIPTIIAEPNIKELCKEEAISYEYVSTVAEALNLDKYEVFTVCKFTSKAGLDVDETIKIFNPSLPQDRINAIITISDMKQEGD